MWIRRFFKRNSKAQASHDGSFTFRDFDDPRYKQMLAMSQSTASNDSLRNMAALRCVSLICESIGMLPVNLYRDGPSKEYAKDHPAYRLLKLKPNDWQTPYEFKSQMQLSALLHGNAYAMIVRSGRRPIRLIPLQADQVEPKLTNSYRMEYTYTTPEGGQTVLRSEDILHLRDLSQDGVTAMSRMSLARNALELASNAEQAAKRVFETGNMAGGAIETPNALSDTAYERMRKSLDSEYTGLDSVNRWMLLEEGATAKKFAVTAQEAQHIENRNAQIEEVARAFGVPRPLLMMDDTSWGSGIEQLGLFFIQYGLQHWFTAWEQALARALLSDGELGELYFKYNEKALLRGTIKDQNEAFARASGAGGHAPWMTQNEIRDTLDLPRSDDPAADELRNPLVQKGESDELDKTARD